MPTNLSKHKRKYKLLIAKLTEIECKYPAINFRDIELKRAMQKHYELSIKLIHEKVDIDFCQSDNPDKRCSDCSCWKYYSNRIIGTNQKT